MNGRWLFCQTYWKCTDFNNRVKILWQHWFSDVNVWLTNGTLCPQPTCLYQQQIVYLIFAGCVALNFNNVPTSPRHRHMFSLILCTATFIICSHLKSLCSHPLHLILVLIISGCDSTQFILLILPMAIFLYAVILYLYAVIPCTWSWFSSSVDVCEVSSQGLGSYQNESLGVGGGADEVQP
jgi:hypothetical protein